MWWYVMWPKISSREWEWGLLFEVQILAIIIIIEK